MPDAWTGWGVSLREFWEEIMRITRGEFPQPTVLSGHAGTTVPCGNFVGMSPAFRCSVVTNATGVPPAVVVRSVTYECVKNLRKICKPLVGSSNSLSQNGFGGSVPVTSLTFYTGDIADTLALKGFGAHSTRLH